MCGHAMVTVGLHCQVGERKIRSQFSCNVGLSGGAQGVPDGSSDVQGGSTSFLAIRRRTWHQGSSAKADLLLVRTTGLRVSTKSGSFLVSCIPMLCGLCSSIWPCRPTVTRATSYKLGWWSMRDAEFHCFTVFSLPLLVSHPCTEILVLRSLRIPSANVR